MTAAIAHTPHEARQVRGRSLLRNGYRIYQTHDRHSFNVERPDGVTYSVNKKRATA